MHAPPKVHFVIANGDQARCVERGEHGFVTSHEFHAHGQHHPDQPRRTVHQSAGGHQSGAADVDVAARRRQDFARDVADHINAEVKAGAYQRLALVAPPRMLNAMRDALSAEARKFLVHELGKDLTKVADHDLDDWLKHPDLA